MEATSFTSLELIDGVQDINAALRKLVINGVLNQSQYRVILAAVLGQPNGVLTITYNRDGNVGSVTYKDRALEILCT